MAVPARKADADRDRQCPVGGGTSDRARRARARALRRWRTTAGFAARTVKNNRQATGDDRSLETIRKLVAERILGNEVFRLAARPKALSPLLFSRYDKACSTAATSTMR